MTKKPKVGDVFRVFQIEIDFYDLGDLGKWGIEKKDYYYGNRFGVNLYLNNGNKRYDHFGFDNRKQAKCVGRLIITKIK